VAGSTTRSPGARLHAAGQVHQTEPAPAEQPQRGGTPAPGQAGRPEPEQREQPDRGQHPDVQRDVAVRAPLPCGGHAERGETEADRDDRTDLRPAQMRAQHPPGDDGGHRQVGRHHGLDDEDGQHPEGGETGEERADVQADAGQEPPLLQQVEDQTGPDADAPIGDGSRGQRLQHRPGPRAHRTGQREQQPPEQSPSRPFRRPDRLPGPAPAPARRHRPSRPRSVRVRGCDEPLDG
jgi:hypothetical protein